MRRLFIVSLLLLSTGFLHVTGQHTFEESIFQKAYWITKIQEYDVLLRVKINENWKTCASNTLKYPALKDLKITEEYLLRKEYADLEKAYLNIEKFIAIIDKLSSDELANSVTKN